MEEIRANYHSHCKRCCHAAGSEEDYVKQGIDNSLSIIGLSDHAPFPDKDYGYRMQYSELDDYFSSIDLLKEKYKSQITVLKSLEIEYMPEYEDIYESLRKDKKVDYLLLGEHFYYGEDKELHNIFFAPDTERYIEYAYMIKRAAATGYFDILAHPDLCMLNSLAWDKNCDKAADIIIQTAVDTGIVLEANANGIRRGITDFPDGERYPYPHVNFWKKVAASEARVIVGSDCHEPQQIWDHAVLKTFDFLDEIGIKPLRFLDL